VSAVISPCGTYRYRLTRAAESLGLSMTNRAVDFAGANENGHYDGDMARNNAHWVHFDGILTKPSWHREGYADAEKACGMVKVGKKAAGRQLDGRTHDEYPEATV
jgi:hypothetical protein